jgi:hypothetical protein
MGDLIPNSLLLSPPTDTRRINLISDRSLKTSLFPSENDKFHDSTVTPISKNPQKKRKGKSASQSLILFLFKTTSST